MEKVSRTIKLNGSNSLKVNDKTPKSITDAPTSSSSSTTSSTVSSAPPPPSIALAKGPQKDDGNKKVDDKLTTTIKEIKPKRDATIPRTRAYWSALKQYNNRHGTRRYIQFIIPVGPGPYILLFQSLEKNEWIIPGGFLNHDEDEQTGIQRIWRELFQDEANKESPISGDDAIKGVKFNHFIAQWYRPEHKVNVYPYKLSHISQNKEIIKVILAELPDEARKLSFSAVYNNVIPRKLFDLYDSKDPEINAIPNLLSKFEFK